MSRVVNPNHITRVYSYSTGQVFVLCRGSVRLSNVEEYSFFHSILGPQCFHKLNVIKVTKCGLKFGVQLNPEPSRGLAEMDLDGVDGFWPT